jgi:hypothetical protein
MKLGLAVALLSSVALAACGKTTSSGHYILRVDQKLDRSIDPKVGSDPTKPIPDSSFKPQPAEDRYEVTVSGDRITIVPLFAPSGVGTIDGTRAASSVGETRFDLKAFAGGSFVIRGARGELTIYGSGVPIASSERGSLIER